MPTTSPCETKTLVYVNQPYIALKEAKVLRRLLMTISGASQAVMGHFRVQRLA